MNGTELFGVLALAVFASVAAVWLRQIKPEFSVVFSIASAALILIFAVTKMSPIVSFIETLKTAVDGSGGLNTIVKIMAVAFVIEFTSDACLSAGEQGIATKVELLGRVVIVITALPLFKNVLELIVKVTE